MLEDKRAWRIRFLIPLLTFLGACGDLHHRGSINPRDDVPSTQRSLEVNLEQLLAFAGDFARLSPPARLAECHTQVRGYAQNRQFSGLLRVFVAQLATEGCGDLAETARVVRAFGNQVVDARLRNLLSFQFALATRNISASAERMRLIRRLDYTRYNLKKAMSNSRQALSSSKQALSKQREALSEREQALSQTREIYRQMVTRDAEARQLKEKLDALKSIEQDVNDTER